MRIFFLFREMMAEPVPKIGANKLLPIWTHRPELGRYDINADLSGIIWSVALVSATKKTCMRLMGLRESPDGVGWRVVKEGHHMFRERDGSNTSRINRYACMICNRKGLARGGGKVDNLQ
jgi:hypothetical protein